MRAQVVGGILTIQTVGPAPRLFKGRIGLEVVLGQTLQVGCCNGTIETSLEIAAIKPNLVAPLNVVWHGLASLAGDLTRGDRLAGELLRSVARNLTAPDAPLMTCLIHQTLNAWLIRSHATS